MRTLLHQGDDVLIGHRETIVVLSDRYISRYRPGSMQNYRWLHIVSPA